jgi:[amino group carrier protein]-L-2-aminoadipate 6-kinase
MTTTVMLENILVIKLGGGAGLDLANCVQDVAQLYGNRPIVLVHGVSDIMNRLCAERGVPVRTLTSPTGHESRYTDPATRDLFVEAATLANEQIQQALTTLNIPNQAVMNAVHGERKTAIRAVVNGRVVMVRDDYSGTVTHVNLAEMLQLLEQGIVPVLPPLALSSDGYLNVDGDRAAASVAGALSAEELIILSNVRGLYRQYPDESTLIHNIPSTELNYALSLAQGRMKRKVIAAQEALQSGVNRVMIGDGRSVNPLQNLLNGMGTVFGNR